MMTAQLGGGQIAGQGVPLELLVKHLSGQLGRIVLDKTGLRGNYDFTLRWTPASAPKSSEPSILTAIQEQLGLKLESQNVPMEILVIDHVEKPAEN
jgi:uncharacterized protein (TIGR03435 family)